MTDFSIRLARTGDAKAFHAVEEDAAGLLREAPALEGIPIPASASTADHARLIEKGRSLTALVGEEIVGFAESAPVGRELHLYELSVTRAHQGRGIGRTLLNALKIDARNSGYRAITLNTFREIPWNAPFYARMGFVEVKSFESRPHLRQSLDEAVALGIPAETRCAMVVFLD